MAAVRSSAIEEDGNDQSYAGMFETVLGVSSSKLEEAVRYCFASKFDYRVFRYNSQTTTKDDNAMSSNINEGGGFALVVMEMIDAQAAGVSFSANPLNSDRDECVVDSSFGLGDSVVDGSVTADRFIFNKIQNKLVDKTIGTKKLERRLRLVEGGGIKTLTIDDKQRQNSCSLPDEKLNELVKLTCIVEENYGIPIDIEWAVTADKSRLVLLQARPITTLFWLDSNMMTQPGERRILYYDYNIASEATTTTPFTHMDLYIYCRLANVFMTGSISPKVDLFQADPTKLMFNASTRQYLNLSMAFYFCSTGYFAKEAMLLDPYLASLFSSKDCDRKKYKAKKWPKDASLKKLVWIIHQIPIMEYYRTSKIFRRDPIKGKEMYKKMVQEDMTKLDQLKSRGYIKDEGLNCYCDDFFSCLMPSINQEMGLLYFIVLRLFSKLDKQRRKGKTEQIRTEYDALCGGYEGDELMEMNIAMYYLANKLDSSVWEQYGHENLRQLADRINQNLHGTLSDLPSEFLSEWSSFMDKYGFDGEDQLFVSSHRYQDDPVLLLARLRNQNAAANPSVIQKEQLAKRQEVMKLHEKRAASKRFIRPFGALSKIRKRNAYLDNLMWIRNAPKLHISAAFGVLRSSILSVEKDLVDANRLEETGDVFHLELEEVDRAFVDQSYDLMALVRPRKAMYERALEATECPLLLTAGVEY